MSELENALGTSLADRYRIERKIGAGGMATVWLAQDLKHDRSVALKVLHPELAAVMGAERFLGEIRTTANLQHPHILPLFDSGKTDGAASGNGHQFLYYVMPFVEGQSLRQRIDKEKQLPIEEAVRIARAVAGALDHAHQKGIIHRDIKPENILLQGDQPMVADFGIALAVSAAGGGRLTETGLSLGTPFYMSPEQASADRDLTSAADVYSLGAMLYEMLAGEPPHTGTTAQAVLARILTHQPARVMVHRGVPAHVDAVIAKSLERLPADRFATAGEFIKALDDPSFRYGDAEAAAAVSHAATGLWKRISLVLGTAAVVLLGLAAWGWLRPAPPEPVTRIAIEVPAVAGPTRAFPFTITPDGRQLVIGPNFGGNGHLLSLDDFTTRELEVNASSVHFSLDGSRYSGNGGQGRLMSYPMTGGPGTTLAEDAQASYSAWDEEDRVWYITARPTPTLARVPGLGGAVESLMGLDTTYSWYVSRVLPGSQRALGHRARGFDPGTSELVLYDPENDTVTTLGPGVEPGLLSREYIVYWLLDADRPGTGTLMGAMFDPESGRMGGAPVPLAEGVAGNSSRWFGGLGAAGTLLYGAATTTFGAETILLGRAGDRRRLPGLDSGVWVNPKLSPDGRYLAVGQPQPGARFGGSADVWVYTLPRGPVSRRTFGGEAVNRTSLMWSPDGSRILFLRTGGESTELYTVPADGSAPESSLGDLRLGRRPGFNSSSLSPDGRTIVHQGPRGLWVRALDDTASKLLIEGQGSAPFSPAISPDGRWVAYVSRETGRAEIYVQSFPVPGAKYQVSLEGGSAPFWSRSGRSIFFDAGDEIREARVNPGPPFEVLSRGRVLEGADLTLTDVLPGDSVFVGFAFRAGDLRTMVVFNFLEEVKAKVGR